MPLFNSPAADAPHRAPRAPRPLQVGLLKKNDDERSPSPPYSGDDPLYASAACAPHPETHLSQLTTTSARFCRMLTLFVAAFLFADIGTQLFAPSLRFGGTTAKLASSPATSPASASSALIATPSVVAPLMALPASVSSLSAAPLDASVAFTLAPPAGASAVILAPSRGGGGGGDGGAAAGWAHVLRGGATFDPLSTSLRLPPPSLGLASPNATARPAAATIGGGGGAVALHDAAGGVASITFATPSFLSPSPPATPIDSGAGGGGGAIAVAAAAAGRGGPAGIDGGTILVLQLSFGGDSSEPVSPPGAPPPSRLPLQAVEVSVGARTAAGMAPREPSLAPRQRRRSDASPPPPPFLWSPGAAVHTLLAPAAAPSLLPPHESSASPSFEEACFPLPFPPAGASPSSFWTAVRIRFIACDAWGHLLGDPDCDASSPPPPLVISLSRIEAVPATPAALAASMGPSAGGCDPEKLMGGHGLSCAVPYDACPMSALYAPLRMPASGKPSDLTVTSPDASSFAAVFPDGGLEGAAQGLRCGAVLPRTLVGCKLARGWSTHKAVYRGTFHPVPTGSNPRPEPVPVVIKEGGVRWPPPFEGERGVGFSPQQAVEAQVASAKTARHVLGSLNRSAPPLIR